MAQPASATEVTSPAPPHRRRRDMAPHQAPTNKTVVLKPTGTIQIANKFSLVERKLLNAIMFDAQRGRFSAQEHSLTLREVFDLIGLPTSRNVDLIKDAVRTLTSTLIEWNAFGDDRAQEWGVCTFLASGKISRGRLKYRLNAELVERVNNPTLFAKIQLLIQSRFNKRHALVLYEFFLDFLSRERAQELVIDAVPLTKLMALLGMEDTKYAESGSFKFFNRDVLRPSLEEINGHTDIEISYKPVRERRTVVALTFTLTRKDSFQLSLGLEDEATPSAPDAVSSGKVGNTPIDAERSEVLISRLRSHGITEKKAGEIVAQYEADRISGNLDQVEARLVDGAEIRNIPAYILSAITEDYRPRKTPAEQRREEKLAERLRAAQAAQERQAAKEEWYRFRDRRLRENFAAQPADWQQQRREEFAEALKKKSRADDATAKTIYGFFRKDGWDSAAVQARFYTQLAPELLTAPEETDLDTYIAQNATRQAEDKETALTREAPSGAIRNPSISKVPNSA